MDNINRQDSKTTLEDDIRDIINYYCLSSESQNMTNELLEVFNKHLAARIAEKAELNV